MAEVIEHSTSQMNDSDLKAIAVYLKDLPAAKEPPQRVVARDDSGDAGGRGALSEQLRGLSWRGRQGRKLIFPPLAGNPVLIQPSAETLIRVVLAGTQAVATKAAPTEPPCRPSPGG